MATLSGNVLTLADWAKRRDPEGKTAKIVELLSQTNEILTDKMYMEGNLPTGHRTTVRTGLPDVFWRLLNQGVQPSKSTSAQIDEGTGMLEAWSEVDCELADLQADVKSFRLSEAQAFIEAMNQEMAETLFYGNSSLNPEEFNGLAIRYGDLSAANAQNILDAGGTGSDNSSVYLVCWGANSIHGIFPKGSKAGLAHVDLGKQVVETTNGIGGSRMLAYREQWTWKTGIALRDWRYVVRICNIDISILVANTAGADLTQLMIKAMHRLPNLNSGKCAFYMNRTCFEFLDIQRTDTANANVMKTDEVDGKLRATFRGVPVRKCDALLETEARVV